jgi:16S rRNA C967 or C1407 C5-methylase (RsmB/RsmF family)
MNIIRIINASIDCVSQFRVNKYPLKNIARDIIKQKKLNSTERSYFLDLVFDWARESYIISYYFEQTIRFFKSVAMQKRDIMALELLADPMRRLEYENFKQALGQERFLLALGDVIKEELVKSFKAQAADVACGLWQKPAHYLACDTRVYSQDHIITALLKCGIKVSPHPLAPYALKVENSFVYEHIPKELKNYLWLMDAGSQIVAHFIKPKAHERVLDLCVGEGGKARIIAMSKAKLYALDNNQRRLDHAKKRLRDFDIEFICADGTKAPLEPESFDWILVDAPCSGSGVIRRNPDLIHRLTKADLSYYQNLQQALLKSAIKLLKPQAKLIYATCSLFQSENQQQIDKLKQEDDFIKQESSLELIPHIHDCDGFFVTELIKSC